MTLKSLFNRWLHQHSNEDFLETFSVKYRPKEIKDLLFQYIGKNNTINSNLKIQINPSFKPHIELSHHFLKYSESNIGEKFPLLSQALYAISITNRKAFTVIQALTPKMKPYNEKLEEFESRLKAAKGYNEFKDVVYSYLDDPSLNTDLREVVQFDEGFYSLAGLDNTIKNEDGNLNPNPTYFPGLEVFYPVTEADIYQAISIFSNVRWNSLEYLYEINTNLLETGLNLNDKIFKEYSSMINEDVTIKSFLSMLDSNTGSIYRVNGIFQYLFKVINDLNNALTELISQNIVIEKE